MERHKLYAERPNASSRLAVWGSFGDDGVAWSSIFAFSECYDAINFADDIHATISETSSEIQSLRGHWVEACQFAYRQQVGAARADLEVMAESIDALVSTPVSTCWFRH